MVMSFGNEHRTFLYRSTCSLTWINLSPIWITCVIFEDETWKISFIFLKAFVETDSVYWQFFLIRDILSLIRKTWFTWNTCIRILWYENLLPRQQWIFLRVTSLRHCNAKKRKIRTFQRQIFKSKCIFFIIV